MEKCGDRTDANTRFKQHKDEKTRNKFVQVKLKLLPRLQLQKYGQQAKYQKPQNVLLVDSQEVAISHESACVSNRTDSWAPTACMYKNGFLQSFHCFDQRRWEIKQRFLCLQPFWSDLNRPRTHESKSDPNYWTGMVISCSFLAWKEQNIVISAGIIPKTGCSRTTHVEIFFPPTKFILTQKCMIS